MSTQFTAIGTVIDAKQEDLIPYLKELEYGHLCNIKKMLEVEYQKVETTKDALNQKLKLDKLEPVKVEEIKKSVQQLYVALQIIEDKCTILEQIKVEKAPKS